MLFRSKLFDLFVETLNGRAALMLRVCEKGNGFQVWSRLHKEYEAKSASRFQGMLSSIMHPEHWRTLKTAEFMENYTKRLGDIAAYEAQKNKVIEDDVKVAVIMKYAPEEVKMALRQAAPSIGESFRALEQVMLNFIISGREYDGQGNV